MQKQSAKKIIEKYASTIKDEVNVKDIELLDESVSVTKTYLPIGSALSEQFWKETGQIIKAAKTWSAHETENGHLVVKQWDKSRDLTPDQFSIRYSGIDESHQTVEWWAIIDLDLTITPWLKAEWTAREISRFLNQMRKDADYTVDQRIACHFSTDSAQLTDIIEWHKEFLMREALLNSINDQGSAKQSNNKESWDITQTFESEEWTATFTLQQ